MSSFGRLNANRLELAEYSSLLRALRTNELFDILSQAATSVTEPAVLCGLDGENDKEKGPAFVDESSPLSYEPLISSVDSLAPHGDSSEDDGPSGIRRKRARVPADEEVWTRWPLKLDQLHAPKWSFCEEVCQIMTCVLPPDHPAETKAGAKHPIMSDDPEDEDAEEGHALHHGTSLAEIAAVASAHHLESILGALVAFMPDSSSSLRGRVKALEWQSALDMVGACRLANQL